MSDLVLYRLVVFGEGGVGKTSLTVQLCLQRFFEVVRFLERSGVT